MIRKARKWESGKAAGHVLVCGLFLPVVVRRYWQWKERTKAKKHSEKAILAPSISCEAQSIDWGVIALNPGEKMGVHGHNEVEETFFFIQGTPKIIIDDVSYDVKEGDAFRLEPLEKHDIHNDTDSPVKFVFIKCPYLPDDKIAY